MANLGTVEDGIARGVFSDTGCKVAPRCLDCPLQVCVYDQPGTLSAIYRAKRDARIWELRKSGVPDRELMRAFGVSQRHIHRVMERGGPAARDVALAPDEAPLRSPFEPSRAYRQRAPWPALRQVRA